MENVIFRRISTNKIERSSSIPTNSKGKYPVGFLQKSVDYVVRDGERHDSGKLNTESVNLVLRAPSAIENRYNVRQHQSVFVEVELSNTLTGSGVLRACSFLSWSFIMKSVFKQSGQQMFQLLCFTHSHRRRTRIARCCFLRSEARGGSDDVSPQRDVGSKPGTGNRQTVGTKQHQLEDLTFCPFAVEKTNKSFCAYGESRSSTQTRSMCFPRQGASMIASRCNDTILAHTSDRELTTKKTLKSFV